MFRVSVKVSGGVMVVIRMKVRARLGLELGSALGLRLLPLSGSGLTFGLR